MQEKYGYTTRELERNVHTRRWSEQLRSRTHSGVNEPLRRTPAHSGAPNRRKKYLHGSFRNNREQWRSRRDIETLPSLVRRTLTLNSSYIKASSVNRSVDIIVDRSVNRSVDRSVDIIVDISVNSIIDQSLNISKTRIKISVITNVNISINISLDIRVKIPIRANLENCEHRGRLQIGRSETMTSIWTERWTRVLITCLLMTTGTTSTTEEWNDEPIYEFLEG